MSDTKVRSLERARQLDPEAEAAFLAAQIRAGARDPRRHPWPGGMVEGLNCGLTETRTVVGTWPRMLRVDVLATPAGMVTDFRTLPQGTLVRDLDERDLDGQGRPLTTTMRALRPGQSTWEPVQVYRALTGTGLPTGGLLKQAPDVPEARPTSVIYVTHLRAHHEVDYVVELHADGSRLEYGDIGPYQRGLGYHTITLAGWRRWAKDGTVRRIGGTT